MHDVRLLLLVALDRRRQQLTRLESFGPYFDDIQPNPPPASLPPHNLSSSPNSLGTHESSCSNGLANGHSEIEIELTQRDQRSTTKAIAHESQSEILHDLRPKTHSIEKNDTDTNDLSNEKIVNDETSNSKQDCELKIPDNNNNYPNEDNVPKENGISHKLCNGKPENKTLLNGDIEKRLELAGKNHDLDDEFEVINDPPETEKKEKQAETKQRKSNTVLNSGITPKLQNMRQKFSSPVITENTVKQSVKSVKSVKASEVTEAKQTSKRVDKADVKPVEKVKKKNSIVDKVDESNEIIDTTHSDSVKNETETIQNSVENQDRSQNNFVNGEAIKPPRESSTDKANPKEVQKTDSIENKKLKKQNSLKRKSITETGDKAEDKSLVEPDAKQVKKLKSCLPEKKSTPTKLKRKSRDYSIDKVRKYNERVKKYNNNVEKVNNNCSPGASTSTYGSSEQSSRAVALPEDSTPTNNSDGFSLNLNVSVNKTVDENSSEGTQDIVSKVSNRATETTDGNEINLDVDIEVSIENSHPDSSILDTALPSPPQQQQPHTEEDDDIADTVMVNQMINDIARRRAQRMVRSKSSFSVDVNDPMMRSPAISLQHSMDTSPPATIPEVEEKPKESFAKRLKDKISNRFTRQSFDKSQSIDLNNTDNFDNIEKNIAHSPVPQHIVNQVQVQQRSSSGKRTPISRSQSSRSMYDSGIEQTPSDLIISQQAMDYNKEDEVPTPGIYKYSEDYPSVKLRDKSARRRDYHKSRGSSLSESKAKRLSFHSSVDFSDHDSKRKSGSHLRYKRSSSKVKMARERSIDKDRFSREHSIDQSSSKRNSLRRQQSHRENESPAVKRGSLSRDKSLSREKSFSREDSGNRSSLLKKRKSFDRQKSMERGQLMPDTQRKFKSHKNKFLEELDLAKKKALIQMLKDNKLNMAKELHKKNIDLKEFEKVKKSVALLIKGPAARGPVRQDSKDEFNASNIRNKFNKQIEKEKDYVPHIKKPPTKLQTDKLTTVQESNSTLATKTKSDNARDLIDSPLKKNTQQPNTQIPEGGRPKIVVDLESDEDYFSKRKNRILRQKDGKDDESADDSRENQSISISQQIDLFNLQKQKEKSKFDGLTVREDSNNNNKVTPKNQKESENKLEMPKAVTNKLPETRKEVSSKPAEPKPDRKALTVKRDPLRSKMVEPSSTKDRAAIFGPRKVFKQVKPAQTPVTPEKSDDKTPGGQKQKGLNLRSGLRKVERPPDENGGDKVQPSSTFLLPETERSPKKTKKSGGGLAALLERDASSRDNLKFEDKRKKEGHEKKEDIRGISADSLKNGKLRGGKIL